MIWEVCARWCTSLAVPRLYGEFYRVRELSAIIDHLHLLSLWERLVLFLLPKFIIQMSTNLDHVTARFCHTSKSRDLSPTEAGAIYQQETRPNPSFWSEIWIKAVTIPQAGRVNRTKAVSLSSSWSLVNPSLEDEVFLEVQPSLSPKPHVYGCQVSAMIQVEQKKYRWRVEKL